MDQALLGRLRDQAKAAWASFYGGPALKSSPAVSPSPLVDAESPAFSVWRALFADPDINVAAGALLLWMRSTDKETITARVPDVLAVLAPTVRDTAEWLLVPWMTAETATPQWRDAVVAQDDYTRMSEAWKASAAAGDAESVWGMLGPAILQENDYLQGWLRDGFYNVVKTHPEKAADTVAALVRQHPEAHEWCVNLLTHRPLLRIVLARDPGLPDHLGLDARRMFDRDRRQLGV